MSDEIDENNIVILLRRSRRAGEVTAITREEEKNMHEIRVPDSGAHNIIYTMFFFRIVFRSYSRPRAPD